MLVETFDEVLEVFELALVETLAVLFPVVAVLFPVVDEFEVDPEVVLETYYPDGQTRAHDPLDYKVNPDLHVVHYYGDEQTLQLDGQAPQAV